MLRYDSELTQIKTNFRDTVSYPTRFLGLHNEYPLLGQETKFVPARTVKGDHGKLMFQVSYQGANETFVAEQVVAAYINKLRNIIQINKLANTEAVLSVPSYYTQIERKALLDAARIAELQVTRLLNESTAVALDYGIFRKNDLDAKVAKNVLFVDFGHSKLSTFAYSFTKEKMTMLAQHHERNLGCRDIDYVLLQFYKTVFEKSSGGLDIFESRKAVVKLVEAIERQRKTLSANSEYTMNQEYLMEENDLLYNMKRDEF
jgi:heat shock protein 4